MAQNIEEFRNSIPVGDLGIIPLQSCSELGNMVNEYIVDWRKERESVLHQDDKIKDSYIVNTKCSRFGSGEAKGTILVSIRGKDLYLLVDVTNYSIEYSLCGHMNKMSPDDHYSDFRIRIEQFADGMIIVQFVDHECDVLAQVYIDVVWTG